MDNNKYDYLIVGAGLFGATFAYFARKAGKRCLVIDKRPHLGGNLYCEPISFPMANGCPTGETHGRGLDGAVVNMHKYGAHIFHTNNKQVWDFVNSLVEFNRYTNSPVANYKGELYNLPFNMNTFCQMWKDVKTPEDAKKRIEEQVQQAVAEINAQHRANGIPEITSSPAGGGLVGACNLEEQALCLVGKDIFEKLIKEYTEKQWGRDCKELPAFIIKRLPVRLVFDNNYFNDRYQGIPIGGYNVLISKLLSLSPAPSPAERGGMIDTLVGIDLPLNRGKYSFPSGEGGDGAWYREMADAMNYELLRDNAKEMRQHPTEAESAFWQLVSANQLGVKFRRQHIIGNYIVDFVCLEKHLVVELDGGYHDDPQQQMEDNLRSTELKEYGFAILRLRNEEVLCNTEAMLEKLKLALWLAEKVPLREGFREASNQLVYTGPIDEYFDYRLGRLDWRTVTFKTRVEETPNYQGNAVMNYTSHDVPYTRVIEHKHFEMFGQDVYACPKTVISEEYPTEYNTSPNNGFPTGETHGRGSAGGGLEGAGRGFGCEPYYPVNDDKNNALLAQYKALAHNEGILFPEDIKSSLSTGEGWGEAIFGGRLAEYKYYDMAPIIEKVMKLWNIS